MIGSSARSSHVELVLLGAGPQVAEGIRSGLADLCTVIAEREPLRGVQRALAGSTSLVVVVLDQFAEPALRAADQLARERPDLPVLAVASQKDPDQILRAMKARVREFVLLSRGLDELRQAVRAVIEQSDVQADGGQRGDLVAVWPGRGGAGASFLAVNIAGSLVRRGKRVVIVDLNLRLGDTLALLDLTSKTPLSKVLDHMSRLDRELLEASLSKHASGIFVLAESDQTDGARELDAADTQRLLAFLRSHFDIVVVDGLHNLSPSSMAALSDATSIFLVITQDVPALKNAHVRLHAYNRAGLDVNQIKVVINRFDPRAEVGPDLISRTLELPVAATVQANPRLVGHAVNRASLMIDLAPREKITAELERLAEMVFAGPAVAAAAGARGAQQGGGLLSKLFGG